MVEIVLIKKTKGEKQMKRNLVSSFLIMILLFLLCGCGSKENKSNETLESTTNQNKSFDEISIGSTIETEFANLSLIDIKLSNTIEDSNLGVVLEDEPDKVYFAIFGDVTNVWNEQIIFGEGFNIDLVIDDKYTYSLSLKPNLLNAIVPLENKSFLYYASLPEEVVNSCEQYSFRIGFNERFIMEKNGIENCDYRFVINGTIDEYGSANSVEDFQSLVEYVKTYISDSNYEDLTIDVSDYSIIVSSSSVMEIHYNDETFTLIPNIHIYHNSIDGEVSTGYYLKFIAAGDSTTHYMYLNNLKISSDNGEIEKEKKNFGDSGTNGSHSWGTYTSFMFDEDSKDEVVNILDGDNLLFSFNAISIDNEENVQFECDDVIKTNMINLFNIFTEIDNNGFVLTK